MLRLSSYTKGCIRTFTEIPAPEADFSVGIGDQWAWRDITQWFSKCGAWNSRQHHLEFVRNINFHTQPRPVDSGTLEMDPAICVFTRPPGDSDLLTV